HLPRIAFAADDRTPVLVRKRLSIGAVLRDAGLPEVFLGQDIAGHRRPGPRHGDALLAEDRRPIRILDLRRAELEVDAGIGTLASLSEPPGDSHACLLSRGRPTRTFRYHGFPNGGVSASRPAEGKRPTTYGAHHSLSTFIW